MDENVHAMHPLEGKIFHAIRHSQYKQLALYLRHNYNLNATTIDGRNGLFIALDINDADKRCRMIKFCLNHGIDPLQKDNINGYTPLHEAIARQQLDSFQILLDEVSAEIDWRLLDTRGRTILHQAVELNNVTILETLVAVMRRYGISVDLLDKNGLTPYLLAIKLHLREMAQILVTKGHASQQKCDLQTHHSAYEWNNIGHKENHLLLRRKLRQEINDAMKKGKINKVKKLKQTYATPLSSSSSSLNEQNRPDSYVTMTTRSGLNTKSSLSINEMIDHLSEGDIPEKFVQSKTDKQTFHLEHIVPTSLPPLTTLRRHRPRSSFRSLIDLFQIAPLST